MTKAEMMKKEISETWNIHNHLKGKTLEELSSIVKQDRLPFSVMCLNLSGTLNIGNIIRTAHILGAREVFVLGSVRFDKRSLVGADKYFPVYRIDALDDKKNINVEIFKDIIDAHKFTPIFLETCGKNYLEFNWRKNQNYCLVVGNEGMGIQENILDCCRENIVKINQLGVIRSLNTASAFAIVCNHLRNILK